MHIVVLALIVALVTTVPVVAINQLSGRGVTFGFGVLAGLINFFVSLMILYWGMPDQQGFLGGWLWVFLPLLVTVVLSAIGVFRDDDSQVPVGSVIGAIFMIVFVVISAFTGVWSQERADALADLVSMSEAPEDEIPPTDPAHIVQVTRGIAEFKASQSMATGRYEGDRLESIFKPGEPVLQSVNGHLFWIVDLDYESRGLLNQVADVNVPGYLMIDAEDPAARVQPVLDYDMQYVPSGRMANNLGRHIYNGKDQNGKGLRQYNFDDTTIEIDDEGKPWYTLAGSRDELQWAGKGATPEVFIIVDPETGDIVTYDLQSDEIELPEWVDRVCSAATITERLDYWGEWGNGADYDTVSVRPQNRLKVADSDPGLVYTEDGRAVWQHLMTSWNADSAASELVFTDARTCESVSYDTTSGITIEKNVREIIGSSPDNLKGLVANNPQLYYFYGQVSWVAVLEPAPVEGEETTSFAGIAILQADKADAASVIIADSLDEALLEYRQDLSRVDNVDDPERTSNSIVIEGEIADYATSVLDGNTRYYIRLIDDDRLFIGVAENDFDIVFVGEGDTVRIRFTQLSDNPEVDISSIDVMETSNTG